MYMNQMNDKMATLGSRSPEYRIKTRLFFIYTFYVIRLSTALSPFFFYIFYINPPFGDKNFSFKQVFDDYYMLLHFPLFLEFQPFMNTFANLGKWEGTRKIKQQYVLRLLTHFLIQQV